MEQTLTRMKTIPAALLEDRLDVVRELEQENGSGYEIMKDSLTGEHYLVYHYLHLRVSDGGTEQYFHFLPLEHDDVIAVMLGEQEYEYPRTWDKPYLRNSGERDEYVWFDPSGIFDVSEEEQRGTAIREKLLSFKQEGKLSEEDIRKLLEELDGM